MRQMNIMQKDENINEKVDKKVLKTTLDHIENIVGLVENSGLNKEFFQKAKKSINFVAKKHEAHGQSNGSLCYFR